MPTTVTGAPKAEAAETAPEETGADQWLCFPATWEVYQGLLDARGERSRPKYTYLDGRITAVSPGVPHAWLAMRLSHLIHEMLVGLSIGCRPSGNVTLHKALRSKEGPNRIRATT
ncbi:MAG: hypothetical protein LC745_00015 [Planctomycetia bacterium]|nr:hypothetical protein [Planctomycetia bacterium]